MNINPLVINMWITGSALGYAIHGSTGMAIGLTVASAISLIIGLSGR